MNRKIKFRFWSGQKMIANENMDLLIKNANNEKALMQFTGLKDKNGVEIYEGDRVQWINGDTKQKENAIVEWDDEFAGFGFQSHCLDWNHELTVIGNIYDNSES